MRKLLTILFFLPLFSQAQTVLHTLNFEDPSKLSEWVKILDSYPGHSFKLDSTIKRSGIASGRFETDITDNATNTANYHSTFNISPETDSTRWYGFSEYFPAPYTLDPEPEVHFQLHHVQDAGDAVGAPPIAFLIQRDSIILNILYSSAQLQTPANTTNLQFYLGKVTRNMWDDYVVHVKFSSLSNGLLQVWRNGNQLVNYSGPNCYKDTTLPYLVFGVYKSPWAVPGNVSTVTQRVVYYDDVKQADAGATYATVAPQQQKIKVFNAGLYDLSDYSAPLSGGNGPWKLFDGNAASDPQTNSSTALPSQYKGDWLPFRGPDGYYLTDFDSASHTPMYRGKRGLRVLVDLGYASDPLSARKWNLSNIWVWDNLGLGDTLDLYDVTAYLIDTPIVNRWKALARPDLVLTPVAKIGGNNGYNFGGRWLNTTVTTTGTRWVLLSARIQDHGGYRTYPSFDELMFYGTRNGVWADTTETYTYTGPIKKKKPLWKVLGANQGTQISVPQFGGDHLIRGYSKVFYYDHDNLKLGVNTYDANNFNQGTGQWKYPDSAKNAGTYYSGMKDLDTWESLSGSNFFYADSSYIHSNDHTTLLNANNIPNIDSAAAEIESPWSYKRQTDFATHYGALFGKNTGGFTLGQLRWTKIPSGFGLGLQWYKRVEPGNEQEFRGYTILGDWMAGNAFLDGWEGRLADPALLKNGKGGLYAGDSTMQLIMPGTVFLDSNWFRCHVLFGKLFRTDKKFIWGAVNYHNYLRTYDTLSYHPTANEQVGQKGELPEFGKLYQKIKRNAEIIWSLVDTSVEFHLSEYGYDGLPQPPPNISATNIPWTTSGTPLIPGLDSTQSKAEMMTRHEILAYAAGLDGMEEFMIHNPSFLPFDSTNLGIFNTSGRGTGGINLPVKVSWYWTRLNMFKYLGDYVFESITQRTDSVNIVKFRHSVYPDSVCYAIWKGSNNGTAVSNVTVTIGNVVNPSANKMILPYTNVAPTVSGFATGSSTMLVTAQESTRFYFLKEILTGLNEIRIRRRLKLQ